MKGYAKTTLFTLVAALFALMLAPIVRANGPGHVSDMWSDSGKSTDTPSSSSDWQNGDPDIHHSGTDMDYNHGITPPTIDYEGNWGIHPTVDYDGGIDTGTKKN